MCSWSTRAATRPGRRPVCSAPARPAARTPSACTARRSPRSRAPGGAYAIWRPATALPSSTSNPYSARSPNADASARVPRPEPADVVRDRPLDVVRRPETGVLPQPGGVETDRLTGPGRVVALAHRAARLRDDGADRGEHLAVGRRVPVADVVRVVVQPSGGLQQRDGPRAVLDVTHVDPVLRVRREARVLSLHRGVDEARRREERRPAAPERSPDRRDAEVHHV